MPGKRTIPITRKRAKNAANSRWEEKENISMSERKNAETQTEEVFTCLKCQNLSESTTEKIAQKEQLQNQETQTDTVLQNILQEEEQNVDFGIPGSSDPRFDLDKLFQDLDVIPLSQGSDAGMLPLIRENEVLQKELNNFFSKVNYDVNKLSEQQLIISQNIIMY